MLRVVFVNDEASHTRNRHEIFVLCRVDSVFVDDSFHTVETLFLDLGVEVVVERRWLAFAFYFQEKVCVFDGFGVCVMHLVFEKVVPYLVTYLYVWTDGCENLDDAVVDVCDDVADVHENEWVPFFGLLLGDEG